VFLGFSATSERLGPSFEPLAEVLPLPIWLTDIMAWTKLQATLQATADERGQ